MKQLFLILFALSLYAEVPKPTSALPIIPVEVREQIREQQVQALQAINAKKDLQMQLQATPEWLKLDVEEKQAIAEINKRILALPKPKGCDKCFVNNSLKWEQPKTEVAGK